MSTKFGFTGTSKFFIEQAKKFSEGLYLLSAALGTLFMTLGADFANSNEQSITLIDNGHYIFAIVSNSWFLVVVGFFMLIFGARGTYLDQKELKKQNLEYEAEKKQKEKIRNDFDNLLESNEKLRGDISTMHEDLVETWLKKLFSDIELDTYARVTIYYEFTDEFSLLARYSKNPAYSKVHSQKFPLNNGVISQVWQHGTWLEKDCPAYDENSSEYKKYMSETYSYPEEKIDKLTMKSHQYYGNAIIDADQHIGVILFESTNQVMVFTEERIEKIKEYCERYQSYMSKFVRKAISLDRTLNAYNATSKVEKEFIELMKGVKNG